LLCQKLFIRFKNHILTSLDVYFIISNAILSTPGCFLFLHFWRTSLSSEGLIGSTPVAGREEETGPYPEHKLARVWSWPFTSL